MRQRPDKVNPLPFKRKKWSFTSISASIRPWIALSRHLGVVQSAMAIMIFDKRNLNFVTSEVIVFVSNMHNMENSKQGVTYV